MKHRLIFLFIAAAILIGVICVSVAAKDTPTEVYLEGTEISDGVMQYVDEDGTTITVEEWTPGS